ncbi:hypothetical protein R1sor_018619 [Riccia sorocarpa]|uniref:RBR-type E3 ubiquitin transferase n=1 Tax=Riccia sorocarpa TaxID=122646 RepID=A0ABD3ICX2_9MARC
MTFDRKRGKDRGKDVKDVFFPSERVCSEEANDADNEGVQAEEELGAAGHANLGEFVSGGKQGKSRNRKKHGGSKGKANPQPSPQVQVETAGQEPELKDAAVSGNSDETENDPPSIISSSAASEECDSANAVTGEGNSTQATRGAEVYERKQGGEDSILQRLGKIIKASVIPPLSENELESNLQEQADESLALEAIYGEDFKPFSSEHIKTPSFMIAVNVETPKSVTLWVDHPSSSKSRSPAETEDSVPSKENPVSSGDESSEVDRRSEAEPAHAFTVQSLPPLRLVYTLPVSYPSHSPPLFTLSCLWLNSSKLSRLCTSLDQLWEAEQGQVVVYSWVEWLKTQTLSSLGISEKLELGPYGAGGEVYRGMESDDRAASGCISFESDISRLLRYNEDKKNEEFYTSLHTCYICFSEHLGKDFIRLPCQHNFCIGCMETLANVHVKEGSVNKLNCPDTSCRGSIPPYVLKELLEEEVFQRWDNLVLQRTLDSMVDIVYCPRCETVCIEEKDNFVQCTQCLYTFCSLCRQSWHVGQECMSTEARLRILEERQKGSKIGEDQRRKEQALINEMMNMQYVRREAKQCPKCKMAISKSEGCNKMVCSNCGQYFCFKCGKKIDGYDHFGDGSCNLFEDEQIAMRWQPFQLMQQQQAQVELELWPERGKPCPTCRQLNVKMGNNNHLFCWACRNSYCCLCYKIVRRTSEHFGNGPNKCRQHSAD